MRNKPLWISVISLILVIILSMHYKNNPAKAPSRQGDQSVGPSRLACQDIGEMRAVWVPFMSLNMAGTDYSERAFRHKFDGIVDEARRHNMNTLIVHVRPFNDALYPSKRFPWSHIVSGKQGKDPGFDPLDYMVTATHRAGMQFHAWINPLRVQINGTPCELCESNLFNTLRLPKEAPQDVVFESPMGKYLNPGYAQVRELIIDGACEIIKKYPVDGIQFDDYFYPPEDGDFDKVCYNNYCSANGNAEPVPLQQWHMANISSLVAGTYSAIKNINPDVAFGISPQCNTANDLKIGADVFEWCRTPGYVDYICPQTYISLEHPVLPFAQSATQWKEMVKDSGIKLYFGLALYKAGSDADSGTWKNHDDILKTQVEQCRKIGCDGFMLFSVDDLGSERAHSEVQNVMKVLN